MKKYIAYYRVSTQKQKHSGLGLDAQKFSVETYVQSVDGVIIESFTEIETAANKDRIRMDSHVSIDTLLKKRPLLLKAINTAKKEGAILVVKEASRLSRFSLLIDFLLSSNVEFVSAESPRDTPLIIKLKTSLNEEEILRISERTRSALKALKERGKKLGTPENLTDEAREKGTKVIIRLAKENPNNKRAIGYVYALRKERKMTYQKIADRLNREGFRTSRGKSFYPKAVQILYWRKERAA
ncbi:MAG: recombinase family protein [Bacteroidetes bacterium]|nr:recombinase family protein [Bacteroidota bacterium]